ncbi:shikimate kinase [Zoogloea sp.]|uniref:shikimate kinase n=1 Tax=Zoogloea sp. TaxID=49181 RepID=UPI0026078243|nr:shikimate kinase [uncultured Zoogloea sp.]MCK6387259.1 shikimate kinase [Zoogloea sp.]
MVNSRCIVLVGMPGSGKTTVGRDLAKRLGLRFVDTDHEIEARTGVKIPTIFEIEGEDGFRKRETQTLDDLTRESNMVLATGGGAVIRAENRVLLRERAVVVFLSVPPAILWERTRHDRSRPLLQVPDPKGRLEELLKVRGPFYREVAHIIVEGGRGTPHAMVKLIEKELQALCEH